MQAYEVTQKILAIGPTYEVRAVGSDAVLYTIRGKLLTFTPKLTLVEGDKGAEIAKLTANFTKTKFTVEGPNPATLSFPLIALKQRMTLQVDGQEYSADGGFLAGAFRCADASGNAVFEILKELSLRDKFRVQIHAALPPIVVLLAAVAIDQRYFQDTYVDTSP
jgi:uncharacterized protein YxjI